MFVYLGISGASAIFECHVTSSLKLFFMALVNNTLSAQSHLLVVSIVIIKILKCLDYEICLRGMLNKCSSFTFTEN